MQPKGLEPITSHVQNGRSTLWATAAKNYREEQDSNLRDIYYPSVFKTDALNHSAILPKQKQRKIIPNGEDGSRTHIAWRDKPASYH